MISLQDVSKAYSLNKNTTATGVQGINLVVKKGEFVVITGRSGSGKTTLLNLVSGLIRPTSGVIRVQGVNLAEMADRQQSMFRNQKMGFIFQFPSLLPSLTVFENVVLPTTFSRNEGKQKGDQRARDLLKMVGLSEKLGVYPRQLSAGQQKRVVIARALVNRPELILADEATADLDEQTEKEIMSLLQKIHSTTGVTILLVTHSRQLISYSTRAIEMANGTLVSDNVARTPVGVRM